MVDLQINEDINNDNNDYLIKCTYPHKRVSRTQSFKTENYIKCNNPYFIVKWNGLKKQATIICKDCHQELTSFNLDIKQLGGEKNDSRNNKDVPNSNVTNNNNGNGIDNISNQNDDINKQT